MPCSDAACRIGIHEEMLRDEARTSAYVAAIARADLRGKV
jgi:hypothetical protein